MINFQISNINTAKPLLTRYRNPNMMLIENGGGELGIPLNIFSNIYTNLHYGYDITNYKFILIQFALGYYVYGLDRLKDAEEFKLLTDDKKSQYGEKKVVLYNEINENKNLFKITLYSSLLLLNYYLFFDNFDNTHIPFLFLIYLCSQYKEYKKKLGIYKSFYISIMWTIASVILPCVLNDNNFEILNYPLDYLPCFLLIFGASNFADIDDILEDKLNGINTISVKYGKDISNLVSLISIGIASILIVENNYFENRLIINSLLEDQQLGFMFLIYNSSYPI